MRPDRREAILNESRPFTDDWSMEIVPDATIEDLDPEAIAKARKGFCERYPDKANEVPNWDDSTFLDKAKVTIKGKITDPFSTSNGSKSSNLNDAYRKKARKLRDANYKR